MTRNEESASELARTISIYGLEKIPLINPGDDAAQLIMDAMKVEGLELMDGRYRGCLAKDSFESGGPPRRYLRHQTTPKIQVSFRNELRRMQD